LLLNTADLISPSEQQSILKVFVKVFLDTTLKGNTDYEGLLRDCGAYAACLPDTVYTQVYEESGFVSLCDLRRIAT
jgi:hypothetical protein